MIYTVGDEVSYERYFADRTPLKMGRCAGYCGGSVWETSEDAQRHATKGMRVYGVEARWGVDTAPSDGGEWHDLLIDAPLVRLQVTA